MRTRIAVIALTTLLASSAFAGRFAFNAPATTNNNDSCDVGLFPAATLLLPYFEVDVNGPQSTAQTTLFTVTNVSDLPQIARVTIWTDLGYPILTFNIFLTGYDVQPINLYDVLNRGIIAPPMGTTSTGMTFGPSPIGPLSAANTANPNIATSAISGLNPTCAFLPGPIPASLIADVRSGLTTGIIASCGTARVGTTHANAIGYATIDVVANCSPLSPRSASYWDELLYDNVLMGDYQQINPDPKTGNYAAGSALVHIRAIPTGGTPTGVTGTNLPYTFYDRLTPRGGDRTRDRRQPLPSAFAARYIQGGPDGFNTNFKIWREAGVGPDAVCGDYVTQGNQPVFEIVRFDEHENPTTFAAGIIDVDPDMFYGPTVIRLPEASSLPTSSTFFPLISTSGDAGGWIYLNLNNGGSTAYNVAMGRDFRAGVTTGPRQSQNWVVASMFAGRYAVQFDGVALGNGCSPALTTTTANGGVVFIGPAPNQTP
jgi:hypothetical protein